MYPSLAVLESARWAGLGPDALSVSGAQLGAALAGTKRAVKAALLDQAVVAGVGNIYADEALFAAGIDPRVPGAGLGRGQGVAGGFLRRAAPVAFAKLQQGAMSMTSRASGAEARRPAGRPRPDFRSSFPSSRRPGAQITTECSGQPSG